MNILSGILDLLFPPRQVCPLCGEAQEKGSICSRCLKKVTDYRNEPVCLKCGRYFLGLQRIRQRTAQAGEGKGWCRDCLELDRYFYMARSVGPYEDDLKKAVLRLKFSGKRDLAGHLSQLMFSFIAGNIYFNRAELITAVPLSRKRLKQRGFNQAELLAGGLAERMAVPLLPVVKKIRETMPQTGLDRAGREENLAGAFELTSLEAVRGKTVLIIDDVITTGNTLNTVSEVFIRGGASKILCLTVAAGRMSD